MQSARSSQAVGARHVLVQSLRRQELETPVASDWAGAATKQPPSRGLVRLRCFGDATGLAGIAYPGFSMCVKLTVRVTGRGEIRSVGLPSRSFLVRFGKMHGLSPHVRRRFWRRGYWAFRGQGRAPGVRGPFCLLLRQEEAGGRSCIRTFCRYRRGTAATTSVWGLAHQFNSQVAVSFCAVYAYKITVA